ncbi:glycosyltransferase [Owenweeksia hongkongensis]|uniref:glycosyltransferase n=1 Tax=Owenweeksia hongkongensis TaxID=253245 RepID=UPI003A95BC25
MWSCVELLFLAVIGIQVLFIFVYALASLFPYKPLKRMNKNVPNSKIKVFIPSYKEDRIIVDTASKALEQSYPKEFYEVVVLADSFSPETLKALSKLDVTVLEVHFENSTKAKSLNKGLEYASVSGPDLAVILDSDNIMEFDFLEKVNIAFQAGNKVIQGHRTAKNQQTIFALLDGINEEIGNSIFRKGHRVLGVGSALIGSAMAFEFNYFKCLMVDIEDVAGEDKLIELKVFKSRQLIEYLPEAHVYDEKVSTAANFSKQRTRWVGAQFYFFRKYFFDGVKELLAKGNFGYFDKVFQMFLIPKVLLIGLLTLTAFLSLLGWLHSYWVILAAIYILSLLMAVPRRYYNARLLLAILSLPKAFLFMIFAILKINKSTASKFEVTEKGNV